MTLGKTDTAGKGLARMVSCMPRLLSGIGERSANLPTKDESVRRKAHALVTKILVQIAELCVRQRCGV